MNTAPFPNQQDGETIMEEKDSPRLIEHAFPLKQASLDSVHEKNVRHGHISTLHIWPARRPLAACRAALIATLLPDPGTPEKRKELCEKIGGKVVKKIERKKMPNGEIVEREKEITEGGILHWGRETENKEDLEWFRQEIRKAYGGRAPKVLDPFAGGGAIPLEAMRLGCEATASDINPVAWFILKCTLEYPQKLAGKTYPLPDFILENEEFMYAFYKAHSHLVGRTKQTKKQEKEFAEDLFLKSKADSGRAPKADLAWHVRAWGQWVLNHARRELARFYPTYADFEPIDLKNPKPYEKQAMRLVPLKEDGTPDVDSLNSEFSKEYLAEKRNPRWVAKPTVAYLWARTVRCKNCRATIPLLKTRWLCKKERKRVLLEMATENIETTENMKENNSVSSVDSVAGNPAPSVAFRIEANVPVKGGNTAQRREHDKRIGAGTMSRSGARCVCCGLPSMTMEDIRLEGQAGRLGAALTAVVVDGQDGKEYRLPHASEIQMAEEAEKALPSLFTQIPFGLPDEPLPTKEALGFRVPLYGFDQWSKLYTSRQLLALGTFLKWTRASREQIAETKYQEGWTAPVLSYLAISLDRLADRSATLCTWDQGYTKVNHVFHRYALPITWDFCEGNVLSNTTGNYGDAVEWATKYIEHALDGCSHTMPPDVIQQSATVLQADSLADVIVTDPPYYDAIPYSDLMDFFYVWLRRSAGDLSPEFKSAFSPPLSPKWDHNANDGELIDDASRHNGDASKSKAVYEEGMYRSFLSCHGALKEHGRLVIVFAHKKPDAWETLVSAMIRAGFAVDGSWPIQTEMSGGLRNYGRASLASSVWLVCKKRPPTARPGWDTQVLEEMRQNIRGKLREFWDAGIRGPDFVWAATGPALEAYSKHPVVKKANEPGPMTVSEFLTYVRRMVVDFVVGRVLAGEKEGEADLAAADRLDEPTAYYLLHRHDFGMDEAPAGACILYAISCGLSDKDLADTWDLIAFAKGKATEDTESTEDDDSVSSVDSVAEEEEDSGSKVKLKTWAQRKSRSLGYEAPGGKPVPLIDRVHGLMHLWKAGELSKVDEYLDSNGLRRHELFKRLLQSLIELSPHGSDERSLLESISNHVQAKGVVKEDRQEKLVLESREP
jgi:putative DNA methylase